VPRLRAGPTQNEEFRIEKAECARGNHAFLRLHSEFFGSRSPKAASVHVNVYAPLSCSES